MTLTKLHKIISLSFMILLTSCSITYIDARKFVIVQGEENAVITTGSELKENSMSQKSDGKIKIPLTP